MIVRWISVAAHGLVERITLAIGGLETALFAIAALMWWTRSR